MAIAVWEDRVFALQTRNMTYAFCVDQNGLLRHLYWGGRIGRAEDFLRDADAAPVKKQRYAALAEEFSAFGGMRNRETSLKVAFSDRTRDFRYVIAGHRVDGDTLCVSLRDEAHPLEVVLWYRVYEEEDVLERWVELRNAGTEEIRVDRLYSAEFSLPGEGYRVMNYNGKWGAEQQLSHEPVTCGKKVFESLCGLTAHGNNPFFAAFREAGEDYGEVFFAVLAYSGNFRVVAEATPHQRLNLLIGMSDQDFCWHLKPGERLEAPHAYCGYTADGFGGMSRSLTRFAFHHVMPRNFAGKPLPVLYNSWYATHFDVFGQAQKELADRAAAVGVELFMIDDGWFGRRDSDRAGLGDWYVNREKVPDGLDDLIDHCSKLGMAFGLWVEPEMVNPDSDLYRSHPEWVFQYPNREILTGRNQYVLNLTLPEVEDHLIRTFDALLNAHRIACVKWDMNRYLSEALSATGDDGRVWREYADGFTRIIRTLRGRHPGVSFEACASGGGRVDYGAMQSFDMYWPSDNTDAVDRLAIQEGYSYLYPVKYMRAWVTDSPNVPLRFRCHCAMCGAYGIGSNLKASTPEDLEILRETIAQYKRIRSAVQFGRLYRLLSLSKDPIQALCYVNGEGAVLFAFQVHPRYFRTEYAVRLKGLDPDGVYRFNMPGENGEERTLSGAYLMRHGLALTLRGDYASLVIELASVAAGS